MKWYKQQPTLVNLNNAIAPLIGQASHIFGSQQLGADNAPHFPINPDIASKAGITVGEAIVL